MLRGLEVWNYMKLKYFLDILFTFIFFMQNRVPVVFHCSEGHFDIRNELKELEIKILHSIIYI